MAKVSYKVIGNYKIDTANKVIVAEMDKLTESELHLISMYIAGGYVIKEKKKGLTYADMFKKLKGNNAATKELQDKINAKENYMQIKKWFKAKTNK